MRVLLDECIPRKLKAHLAGHECRTVSEAGWAGKRNGELLSLAESSFDVFLTLDKGVQYQQNLSGRVLAVLIVRVQSNRIEDLITCVPACLAALESIRPSQVIRLV
jgi:predicted nuclease of predicted toxin-antitoxin system